jgi:ElaB/YqjD/DUF883 family membrane-anchored ribosome-binding protein
MNIAIHNRSMVSYARSLRASSLVVLALVALVSTSCGDAPPAAPTATTTPPTTAQPASAAPAAAAAPEAPTYTFQQKDEFQAHMKTQLDKLNADIAELSAKIDKATEQAKADAKPKLQALRDQAAKLGDMLGKAQLATESSWDAVKADFKAGYANLEVGIRDARTWLSSKIAP